jgi:hypothetical protein
VQGGPRGVLVQQMLMLSCMNAENPHLPVATLFRKLGYLQRFASLLLYHIPGGWLVGSV